MNTVGGSRRHRVWCLLTESGLLEVCSQADYERLRREFDLTLNPGPGPVTYEELVAEVGPCAGLITGWGAGHALGEDFFAAAERLRIIAHFAGSVRHLLSPEVVRRHVLPRGIVVFTGRGGIAENVAESTVGLLIAASRRWFNHVEHWRRTGETRDPGVSAEGQHLLGSTLGVLGASQVGRRVLGLLRNWDLRRLLYDPYLSAEGAAALGAEQVGLEELFRQATHVAVCLPLTEETRGMISGKLLRLLPDGAVFVNAARGGVVDMAALTAEAVSGRLTVGLDVTDPQEPLPAASPLRELPNAYVLPHLAGRGRYGLETIGRSGLQALHDCFAGRAVQGALDLTHSERLA